MIVLRCSTRHTLATWLLKYFAEPHDYQTDAGDVVKSETLGFRQGVESVFCQDCTSVIIFPAMSSENDFASEDEVA